MINLNNEDQARENLRNTWIGTVKKLNKQQPYTPESYKAYQEQAKAYQEIYTATKKDKEESKGK